MLSQKLTQTFFVVLLLAINFTVLGQTNKKNYVVTNQNQTFYFTDIVVNKYFMNVKCSNYGGDIKKFLAKDLIKVQIGDEEYQSGRVTTADIGAKQWRLLKLRPGKTKTPEVSVYYYVYDTSIDGYTTTGTDTAYAFRNTNSIREDFKKIVWPVWQKSLIKEYPNCPKEYQTLIKSYEITKTEDVFELIDIVNEKYNKR